MSSNTTSVQRTICLLTRMGGPNFGSNLQAYALVSVLRQRGYAVRLFSGIPCDFFGYHNRFDFTYYLRLPLSLLGLYTPLLRLKLSKAAPGKFPLASRKINRWVRQHLPREHIFFPFQLTKLKRRESIFLVGSDQVWNTYVGFNPEMYLEFVDHAKRISYGTSLGALTVKAEYRERMRDDLLRFDHISVREPSAITTLNALTGRADIQWVLDPTFLITADEWRRLAARPQPNFALDRPYIFGYFLGDREQYSAMLTEIQQKTGITDIIVVPLDKERPFFPERYRNYLHADPFEFVWLIEHAAIVCSDSFHATALSINLNRPFIEFMRFDENDVKSENSRLHDLLAHFELSSRVYHPVSDGWMKPIDYSIPNRILKADRHRSLDYLIKAIEN